MNTYHQVEIASRGFHRVYTATYDEMKENMLRLTMAPTWDDVRPFDDDFVYLLVQHAPCLDELDEQTMSRDRRSTRILPINWDASNDHANLNTKQLRRKLKEYKRNKPWNSCEKHMLA